jgi:hypothetical protein
MPRSERLLSERGAARCVWRSFASNMRCSFLTATALAPAKIQIAFDLPVVWLVSAIPHFKASELFEILPCGGRVDYALGAEGVDGM